MNDKKTEAKAVYALTERDDKTYWTRIGVAFENRDGSITCKLDALPVTGQLQIRSEDRTDGRDERAEREERPRDDRERNGRR